MKHLASPCPFSWLALVAVYLVVPTMSAQEAKVRTSIETKGDIWIGERVTLVVELLAPGFFASAPAFDLPDPKGMLLLPPNGSPTVGSDEIDGISYTVQRHELSVFAQHSGENVVPPLTARFKFKRHPLDKDSVDATVKTDTVKFVAKAPPGAEKLGNIISARKLTAVETWKPEIAKAKAGDAFTRTITFAAPDVPAMAFPPFFPRKIDGLGIYPKPPEVLDHSERGSLRGERRDSVTYVCERPGRYLIPAMHLTWWDLDSQQLRTIDFPAQTLEVAPNPAMASATAVAATTPKGLDRRFVIGLTTALGANLLALLLWKVRPFWQPIVDRFRPVHLEPLNPGDQSEV